MRGTKKCRRAQQFASDFLIGLAVFLAVLALAFSEHHSALSAPAFHTKQAATAQGSPANVTSGTLFILGDRDDTSAPIRRAQHVSSTIDVVVNGPIARVSVIQEFANMTGAGGRGHFAFPLPRDTSIDTFSVQTGDRFIQGHLVTKTEAERLFEDAKSAGQPVLEPTRAYAGASSIDIHQIDANASVTIRFTYSQVLQNEAGSTSFHFPLHGLSPPHHPKGVQSVRLTGQPGTHTTVRPGANVSLQVRLNAGFPLNTIHSRSHDISVRKNTDGTAVLNLSRARIATDKDFQLDWQVRKSAEAQLSVFKETHDKEGHILALLSAPELKQNTHIEAREVIFAIDTSGSMAGPSLAQLKNSLRTALSKLTSRDLFNIISYNSQAAALFRQAQRLTPESLSEALSFVDELEARGGTEALSALDAALTDNRPEDTQRIRQIIFVTDGEIAGASEFLARIAAKRGRSRLFMVGIGSDISQAIMQRAAEIGRGQFVHVTSRTDVDAQLTGLMEKLQGPVVTDIRIEWPAGVRADTSPNPLPDLYAGETFLLSGELSSIKGDIQLSGNLGGQSWKKSFPLANAVTGVGISKYWTKHKIAALETRRYAGQSQSDVEAAIEVIALKHGVPSRLTRLVGLTLAPGISGNDTAAGKTSSSATPASAWVNDGISRLPVPDVTEDRSRALISTPAQTDRSLITSAIPDLARSGDAESSVKVAGLNGAIGSTLIGSSPQAGEAGILNWTLVIMAIVFATMTALTLGLWRHLRQAVTPQRTDKRVSRTP